MKEPATATDDPAEPDLYWAGASGWAMLPGMVVGGLASAVGMFVLPPAGRYIGLPVDWSAFVLFWIAIIFWVSIGLMWAYRGSSLVYRLTPRHLYIEFGRLYPPQRPIPLAEITGISVRAWVLRRWFGVGTVIVRHGEHEVRLRAIFQPHRFAAAIEEAVAARKKHPG